MIFRFSVHALLASVVVGRTRVAEKRIHAATAREENDRFVPDKLLAGDYHRDVDDVDAKGVERSLRIELPESSSSSSSSSSGTRGGVLRNHHPVVAKEAGAGDGDGVDADLGILGRADGIDPGDRPGGRDLVVGKGECDPNDPYFRTVYEGDDLGFILYDCVSYYTTCGYLADFNCWDVSRVTDMSRVLYENNYFNSDIKNWDTSRVTDMSYMFAKNTQFNRNIEKWDVSSVTTMKGMFKGDTRFNSLVNKWDVSSVQDMTDMFKNAKVFNKDLDGWDVSSVTSTRGMFSGAKKFNRPVDDWDTSSVTDMSSMFEKAKKFNQCLSTWSIEFDGDDRLTSKMFEGSRCRGRNDASPPDTGPWCRYEDDGCYQEGPECSDADGVFSYSKSVSCDSIRSYPIADRAAACLDDPAIAAFCPTVCDGSCQTPYPTFDPTLAPTFVTVTYPPNFRNNDDLPPPPTDEPTVPVTDFFFVTAPPIKCPEDDDDDDDDTTDPLTGQPVAFPTAVQPPVAVQPVAIQPTLQPVGQPVADLQPVNLPPTNQPVGQPVANLQPVNQPSVSQPIFSG